MTDLSGLEKVILRLLNWDGPKDWNRQWPDSVPPDETNTILVGDGFLSTSAPSPKLLESIRAVQADRLGRGFSYWRAGFGYLPRDTTRSIFPLPPSPFSAYCPATDGNTYLAYSLAANHYLFGLVDCLTHSPTVARHSSLVLFQPALRLRDDFAQVCKGLKLQILPFRELRYRDLVETHIRNLQLLDELGVRVWLVYWEGDRVVDLRKSVRDMLPDSVTQIGIQLKFPQAKLKRDPWAQRFLDHCHMPYEEASVLGLKEAMQQVSSSTIS